MPVRHKPYYGTIVSGRYPCLCDLVPGLHRHDIDKPAYRISEGELLEAVRRICRVYGVIAKHDDDSRRQEVVGWPDLVLVGQGGTIFRELKDHYRSPTDEQWRIGGLLNKSGEDWAVWRPAQLVTAQIETRIAAIA